MNDCVKIYLPDGNIYRMVLTKEKLSDDEIYRIRNLFSSAKSVEIAVELSPQEVTKGIKSQTIVLWGDVLAKTYIKVQQY